MRIVLAISTSLLLTVACGGPAIPPEKSTAPQRQYLPPMGFSIQVGAFSNIDNALRLTRSLQQRGIKAYHFLHSSGLYKVRFANYDTRAAARKRGENLKRQGIIETYYIVDPRDAAAAKDRPDGNAALRKAIVTTASRYVGVPYRWGGESPRTGFDCSGLTMVVYRINGLNLPRSSRQQWNTGVSIHRHQLQKGDLVFFATRGGSKVSHVGIYTGGDKFLHAPGRGRRIQTSSLSSRYYRNRYVGARSYL
ncbi:MAG: NlpC/P60 family protein [Desulfobacterales bacterium]|jgi:cell wall-associated NlpC family hydrolase